MKFWQRIPIFFFAMSLALPLQAEPVFDLNAFKGGKVYYQPGFSFLGTSDLNQNLELNGFSAMSSTFLSQNFGAQVVLDRIILGASGTLLNGFSTASAENGTLQASGGHGLFQVGYMLYSENGFSIYPILGIGSGSVKLSGTKALNEVFDISATNPINSIESSQIVLDLGIGADYLVDFNADPGHASGVLVGLRAGYLLIPSPNQWSANGQILAGRLPNFNTQGLYLNLSLGGGSLRSEF